MSAAAKKAPAVEPVIVAYKGFDKDFKCRDFRYEIGKTYTHKGKVIACESGFHACENPLDMWTYYAPTNGNRFCRVELSGELSRQGEDSKVAGGKITVSAEIGLPQIIADAVKFVMALVKASPDSTAATTGNRANAATTGNWANAATTGKGANAATTGNRANAATTGNWANAATTGEGANAATTGNWANAATTGEHAVAAALGIEGKAKASAGGAIVVCYRNDDGGLIHIRASKVGENGIKPNVWYSLDAAGEFVEAEAP